jgi:hypothetical protein
LFDIPPVPSQRTDVICSKQRNYTTQPISKIKVPMK